MLQALGLHQKVLMGQKVRRKTSEMGVVCPRGYRDLALARGGFPSAENQRALEVPGSPSHPSRWRWVR